MNEMRKLIEACEDIDENIFGDPANKKSTIIRYAGLKAEDAIGLADLGKQLYAGHSSAKLFEEIRQELIELKRWLRARK